MENQKPKCKLIGEDGNILNLVEIAARTLRRNGKSAQVDEMRSKVYSSENYEDALTIIGEYVEII